jgi:Na+(H+)/acetate symporter ActP
MQTSLKFVALVSILLLSDCDAFKHNGLLGGKIFSVKFQTKIPFQVKLIELIDEIKNARNELKEVKQDVKEFKEGFRNMKIVFYLTVGLVASPYLLMYFLTVYSLL